MEGNIVPVMGSNETNSHDAHDVIYEWYKIKLII